MISDKHKKEIFYNIINSLLAGGLVFFGALMGGLTEAGILAAIGAAAVVALTKFKTYWDKKKIEYFQAGFFNFI